MGCVSSVVFEHYILSVFVAGMFLMLHIFHPIVFDLGCLSSYGGVVFTCAEFSYHFALLLNVRFV